MIVVYPGTFDPITHGHTDLIRRASRVSERVIVGVAESRRKDPCFTLDQRVAMAREVVEPMGNVEVRAFRGLTVDFARSCGAHAILRGLRAVSDFEYEFQMASMNRNLDPEIETLFLTPSEQYAYVSSTVVREIARMGGDVAHFVSPLVVQAINEIMRQPGNRAC
ncbi:MAG: pantetheine-phosphate adenylyltransferase [Thiotrichales bacterium]